MIHCLSHFANHFHRMLGLFGKYIPNIMQLLFMQRDGIEPVLGNRAVDDCFILSLQLSLYLHLA